MSLWKRTHVTKLSGSPRLRFLYQIPHILKETSLCICQKASYTVEAAIVIPLMAVFFMSVLFFFRILQVQCDVEEALIYAGRKTAVESSAVNSSEALLVSAKGYLLYALKDSDAVEDYVKGGSLGVLLLGSSCQGEEIYLKASYELSLPIDVWDIGRMKLYSQNCFQKWNGDVTISDEEDWIYITPTGTVYHTTPSCQVLDIVVREIPLSQIGEERGKNGQKYYACSRCKEPLDFDGMVYCTNYGTLYHMDVSCSYLKRTIQKVKLEELEGRLLCSFCD